MSPRPKAAAFLLTLFLTTLPFTLSQEDNYDYYSLALEWSGTVCKFAHCQYDKSAPKTFNIHGLWPDKLDGNHPFFCTQTALNLDNLSPALRSNLNSYWSGLYSAEDEFLNHEWSKHGTCWRKSYGDMTRVPHALEQPLLTARNYQGQRPSDFLNLVVTLSRDVYNVYEMLEKNGIVPSEERSYSHSQIQRAFKEAYGVTEVHIECVRDESGKPYFSSVMLCLDKNYNPINCTSNSESGCPANEIRYPIKGEKVEERDEVGRRAKQVEIF